MSLQIYAGNLPYDMSDEALQELFEPHGSVSSVKVIRYRDTGRSKGFGFVEMDNNDEANNAIEKLNDLEVSGRNIKVNVAKPKKDSYS